MLSNIGLAELAWKYVLPRYGYPGLQAALQI